MTKRIVTIGELAEYIYAYARDLATDYNPEDIADDDGNAGGDIRLQIVDGGWTLHTGDASYDTDHRGAWGAGSISAGASRRECREAARDLIEQAEDQLADQEYIEKHKREEYRATQEDAPDIGTPGSYLS